jgi:hypothetical protein
MPGLALPTQGEALNTSQGVYATELLRHLNGVRGLTPGKAAMQANRRVLRRLARPRVKEDVDALFKAMEACVATIEIDDNAPGLREVYDQVSEKYLSSLLNPEPSGGLFARRVRKMQYVTQDYLSQPGVDKIIERIVA